MNIGVDCWSRIASILGQQGDLESVRSLALVSKQQHKAVRKGATSWFRWKAVPAILDPKGARWWAKDVNAVTLFLNGNDLSFLRLARPDIMNVKLIVTLSGDEKKKKLFVKKSKRLEGMKRLHFFIPDKMISFAVQELPEGLETFKLERPDCLINDKETNDVETYIPVSYPDSLREFVVKSPVWNGLENNGDTTANPKLPNGLVVFHYQHSHAGVYWFDIDTNPIPKSIESFTIVRNNMEGFDYEIMPFVFWSLKHLTLIDIGGMYSSRIEMERFPKLEIATVTGLEIEDFGNRRVEKLETIQLEMFGCETHDAVRVVLKPNKKLKK